MVNAAGANEYYAVVALPQEIVPTVRTVRRIRGEGRVAFGSSPQGEGLQAFQLSILQNNRDLQRF